MQLQTSKKNNQPWYEWNQYYGFNIEVIKIDKEKDLENKNYARNININKSIGNKDNF